MDPNIPTQPATSVSPEIQTPVVDNIPSVPSKSSKKAKYILLMVLILLIITAIGGGIYFFNFKTENSITNTKLATIENKPTPTTNNRSIPKKNVLYLGTYENSDGIFYITENHTYYENGVQKDNPYNGELRYINGSGSTSFDYRKLNNPRPIILNLNLPLENVNDLKFNNSKTVLYVSLSFIDNSLNTPLKIVNKIFQINTTNLSSKDVWTNSIGSGKYKIVGAKNALDGAVYIDKIANDKFVSMYIADCYACGGGQLTNAIILNIKTKIEKFLSNIGNIQFDFEKNVFSYQKLSSVTEICKDTESPDCIGDGKMTIMKPLGETYTEALP